MQNIVDQYNGDPTYARLYSLVKKRPRVRESIKTASFDSEKIANLPSSAFAWESERRFPVHTKEDAIASILYRTKLGSAVPAEVDEKLAKAAAVYSLDKSLFEVEGEKEETTKVAYALPKHNRLPLGTEAQIKMAEHVLNRDYSRLKVETRAEAYTTLVKEAENKGVELDPVTLKVAGLTSASTKVLVDWLEARAAATSGAHQKAFDKLASELSNAPETLTNRKDLVKLASTIEQLDRDSGLNKYYDRKLPDPMKTVFNMEKNAGEMCDVAGKLVPCSTLMNLEPEVWEQVDAPEIADVAASGDEQQFKQVFDTLPLDIKVVLKDYV